jgi:hypothetical protein
MWIFFSTIQILGSSWLGFRASHKSTQSVNPLKTRSGDRRTDKFHSKKFRSQCEKNGFQPQKTSTFCKCKKSGKLQIFPENLFAIL